MTESEMIRAIYDEMQGLKTDVQGLKTDMQGLKTDMQELKTDVQELKTRVGTLETDMQFVKNEVCGVQLTLENETNKNIRIIAEGHLDLNRKLDAALKVEEEKEMDRIRLTVLENDMRRVKDKVGIA